MFKAISAAFCLFLIFALVAPIQASGPCSCEYLPTHTGTIIGDLDDLLEEVVSDVIEPVGSAVTSLLDNLLSGLLGDDLLGGHSGLLGGLVGSEGLDLDDLIGSEGIDLGDVVSEVGDLLEDLLGSDGLDLSECPHLNIYQNNFFYRFNSGYANHLVLHGFSWNVFIQILISVGIPATWLLLLNHSLTIGLVFSDLALILSSITIYPATDLAVVPLVTKLMKINYFHF